MRESLVSEPKKILLHACCGPCSTHCVNALRASGFEPVVFFSNSNIDTREEFEKRLATLELFAKKQNLKVIVDPYNPESWDAATSGLEAEREGGARCDVCFRHNLLRAAKEAKALGLKFFTTSLTVSPHKNSNRVFAAGKAASAELGAADDGAAPAFSEFDFKKKGGFLESVRLAREYGLYRQNYCGCRYSKRDSVPASDKS